MDLGVAAVRSCCSDDLLRAIASQRPDGRVRTACFCEASLFAAALKAPRIAEVLAGSDWVFADGVSVRMIAKRRGTPFPERMAGPTFLMKACEYGVRHGWRHFFYGGAAGVAERLAERVTTRFPGLQVAGVFCPPFRALSTEEDEAICDMLERAEPTILWVALGSPRQELWVDEHKQRLKVPFVFPVGAAFDFHAGARPWAPGWVRRVGLEWLFRMCTGGRRIFIRNCRCVSQVALFIALDRFRHSNGV